MLQRGWCVIGNLTKTEDSVKLADAHVIRAWGTTKGIGEIALHGPTKTTILDPCGEVEVHQLAIVLSIKCDDSKW